MRRPWTADGRFSVAVSTDGLTVTNTQTKIEVTKVWSKNSEYLDWDEKISSLELKLTRKKGETADSSFGENGTLTLTVSKEGTFTNLPDGVTGKMTTIDFPKRYLIELVGLEKSYVETSQSTIIPDSPSAAQEASSTFQALFPCIR